MIKVCSRIIWTNLRCCRLVRELNKEKYEKNI